MKKLTFITLLISIAFVACNNETANVEDTPKKINMPALTGVQSLEIALKENPDSIDLYYQMASALFVEGRSTEALEFLAQYETKEGHNESNLYYMTATVYEKNMNDPVGAIPYYDKLAKVSDESCRWYEYTAKLAYTNLSADEALKYFDYANTTDCLGDENKKYLQVLELDLSDFKNDEYKVSFKYPSAWKTAENKMPEMYFYEAVDQEMGVNFNITVSSDQNLELSNWKASVKVEVEKEGAEVLSSTIIRVNEKDCCFTSVKRKVEGSYIIQNNYILLKNGHSYMMNFTCPEILYEDNKEIENFIVRSITIE